MKNIAIVGASGSIGTQTLDVLRKEKDIVLSEAIVNMAQKLGLKVIAEGVETQEELASVIGLGFDLAQGFYLARPEFALQELAPHQIEEISTLVSMH